MTKEVNSESISGPVECPEHAALGRQGIHGMGQGKSKKEKMLRSRSIEKREECGEKVEISFQGFETRKRKRGPGFL